MTEIVGGRQSLRQALRFERQMYEHALALTHSDADASDLVQDTFERALRSWHRLRPGTDVRLWLVKLMTALHASRRAHDDVPAASLEHLPRSAATVPEPLPVPRWQLYSLQDVAAALDSLPQELADVYRMRMVEQLPTDAVVEKLHLPRPTVAADLVRALGQIRSILTRGPAARPR
jgi:RNA polymerase sigma factor (sigma-70 family)